MRVILVLFFLLSSASADDKKYSIADIKELVADKHYEEALVHLREDFKPTERTADWKDLAGQAAAGFASAGKDDVEKLINMMRVEEAIPSVVKHARYAEVRTALAPKGFAGCYERSYDVGECNTYAQKFIDADPSNGKLALAVAKAARKGQNAYGAVPLFKRAVAATKTACKDKDLELSVIAALGLPTDHDLFADGHALAADRCWPELRPAILKKLGGASGYYKDNACGMLRAKGEKAEFDRRCANED